ncbi:2-keto-4-pentenoate hydratase [Roseivivax lentus]|uniref:2-keto-4-pentenoate hydratase n=1 Tax=Roseivivax lentus TaxID=633194 RepID=A0A1N7KSP3_9RHOB|nr:hydratase [Roseivivax lentus]SIS64633.1 2-keto-4-pentenoate hydratase [Roseivivax lentus]
MGIEKIVAEALLAARLSGTPAEAEALPPVDYEQALGIQRIVQDRLGPVGGFKVARRPEGKPVIAPIPADAIQSGDPQRPVAVPVRDRLGIELEIGFEVVAPPGADPMSEPARVFRPCIALELVASRLRARQEDALLKLADMQMNHGLVRGAMLEGWDGRDFGTVEATLTCGGRMCLSGRATVPGGSALRNLGLLCAHLGDHCGGLQPGQIVITGSISGLAYFPAGTDVTAEIAGLGRVGCKLV